MISYVRLGLLGEGVQEAQVQRFPVLRWKATSCGFGYLKNLVLVFYYEWVCDRDGRGLGIERIPEDDFLAVFVLIFIHVYEDHLDF